MNQIKNISHVYIATMVALVACVNSNQEKKLEQLEREVIKLHDEIMPMMGPLHKVKGHLQKKAEADSSNVELVKAIIAIETAEETMMNWMHNYDMTFEGADATETVQYFSEKKISIEQIIVKINEAMVTGERMLKSSIDIPQKSVSNLKSS